MRVIIENNATDALRFTGDYIVDQISEFAPSEDKPFTIVLPNPVPSMKPLSSLHLWIIFRYDHLVKGYKNGHVSFRHVVFFQLEEFRDIPKDDRRSFASRMYDYFFKYVDAVPQNVYFLNGVATDYEEECKNFEKAIKSLGGLRLVCAEVDAEAAIGGNAPGSCLTSRTRQKTRTSFILNDRFHTRNGLRDVEEEVEEDELAMGSNYVLTMGLGTIMEAHEVFALFIGAHAARALHHVLEESVSNMFPASVLQYHDRVCVMAERRSISTLKYTTVEYFVGLRENYNVVHNLGSQLNDRRSVSRVCCRVISISSCIQIHS